MLSAPNKVCKASDTLCWAYKVFSPRTRIAVLRSSLVGSWTLACCAGRSMTWVFWFWNDGGEASKNSFVRKPVTVMSAVDVVVSFLAAPTTSA